MIRNIDKIFLLLSVIVVTACIPEDIIKKSERYGQMSDPLDAVIGLRKELQEDSGDVAVRSLLKQYEIRAAEHYYHIGRDLFQRNEYSQALDAYKKGLAAHADFEKLNQAVAEVSAYIEAEQLYKDAVKSYQVGKYQDAEALLITAVDKSPNYSAAEKFLQKVQSEMLVSAKEGSVIESDRKITLNFRGTDIKTAFGFLAATFSINVSFDESVKEQSLTLYAKDVSFKQALNLMMSTSNTFYKKVGANTLLIVADTKSKREQFEDHIIRTFQLRTIPAKDMAEIIKGVIKVNKMVLNESMNTIMIRDSETMLSLAEDLIEINDRRPAELLLEVEILEVNRNKAEQLGLDYGSLVTATFPTVDPAKYTVDSALAAGTITLPNVAFRYFKQDVDAKTLANPKIRVINQKEAKIHIGDRVPLRSSTIQNASGQTQTSYEYSDIGIRLDVNPTVHFDNTVTVKVNLEVSSLGQNLGTPEEPTYSIGTRNTQTYMMLRDGETAVIGGLIRDEDRGNQVRVPGFGDIPIIGRLFRSNDNTVGRTDVLLTITPKVVRGWDIPRKSLRTLYSGTAERFSTEPMFAANTAFAASIATDTVNTITAAKPAAQERSEAAPPNYLAQFDQTLYEQEHDQNFTVGISMNSIADLSQVSFPFFFNKDVLEVVEVTPVANSIADLHTEPTAEGVKVSLNFKEDATPTPELLLFNVTLRGQNPGISYLTLRHAALVTRRSKTVEIDTRASRVVIR